LLKGGEMKGY
jgi:SNF2 family DNA or RNA helicase